MPGRVHPLFRAQCMFTFIHLTGVPELIWSSSCRSPEISFAALASVGPSFTHKLVAITTTRTLYSQRMLFSGFPGRGETCNHSFAKTPKVSGFTDVSRIWGS